MIDFHEYFKKRVDEMVSGAQVQTAFFFRGFLPKQIAFLVHHPKSLLNDLDVLESDGTLNLASLEKHRRQIVKNLMISEDTIVGFYEELIVASSVVKDLHNIYDGEIVVVNNSLFQGNVPSCLPEHEAKEFYQYIQSDKKPANEEMQVLCKYYVDAVLISEGEYLLGLSNVHKDPGYKMLDVFVPSEPTQFEASDEEVFVGGAEDLTYRMSIMKGKAFSTTLIVDEEYCRSVDYLCNALSCLEIPFEVHRRDTRASDMEYDPSQFDRYLKKYWGSKAAFRSLTFYSQPNISKDTMEISQGSLVSEIVDQCEAAIYDDPNYRDIFITAPTGAGKSLLFQLPALYLNEKYQLITLVVTPLVALMHDQVAQLERDRGVNCVTYLNSKISFEERQRRIEEIHRGNKSIIYLAPELLLAAGLRPIIGDRKIGLFVIDEAHTVTSWGRDFRPDYWFLGSFLKKERKAGNVFPVLCLTATAVYSGRDDIVNDTIAELDLHRPILHLGNVKRENIEFDIKNSQNNEVKTRVEIVKKEHIVNQLVEYVEKGEKTLVYCPYRTHVEEICALLSPVAKMTIRRYHAGVPDEERKLTEREYRQGKVIALVCTKAFGMGVDVKDIKHIIHYAPSGNLADYIQEIGRAARDKKLRGYAHIEFYPTDMRYVKSLNGMSELKQYQLQAMLKKLYDIYSVKKHRNILVAPDSFSHLFPERDLENRVKNGLLLIEKDLKNRYTIPVIVVRPKTMLTQNYVNVPEELEQQFIENYGAYATKVGTVPDRMVASKVPSRNSDVRIINDGIIYAVKMGELWENHFPNITFAQFKRQFFDGELLKSDSEKHFTPRIRVQVQYQEDFDAVIQRVTKILDAIENVLDEFKRGECKTFDDNVFREKMNVLLQEQPLTKNQITLLLDMITLEADEHAEFTPTRRSVRVLQKRKQKGKDGYEYLVSSYYTLLREYMKKYLYQCKPIGGRLYESYLPIGNESTVSLLPILKLMEILECASYELRGGEKAEIFVRINDPEKIGYLGSSKYSNAVLKEIVRRHRASQRLLHAFFTCEIDNESRWDIVEDYFLGREEEVAHALGFQLDEPTT